MPLHINEIASEKALNIKEYETYVKESYSLSREKITSSTQTSSDLNVMVKQECEFKGCVSQTQVNSLQGMKYKWAPKRSYRLEQMLGTILNLPNRHNIFIMNN